MSAATTRPAAAAYVFDLWQEEVVPTLRRLDLAFYLAWSDTRTRYKRSFLGPFWLVLGTAIGVGGLAFVWSRLFEADNSVFVPSLTIGLVVWYLISSSFVDSAAVFYRSRELLLNVRISSLQISLQLLLRQLVNFAHNLVVVAGVLMIYPQHLSLTALWAIPGLILVCINLMWVVQLLGFLGARYRDLEPLVAAVMQPLFFITPVIFRPEQLSTSSLIVVLNPFAHWLSLIRDPLMGVPPSLLHWSVSIGLAIGGWALALWITSSKRSRLAYWVH